MALPRCSTWLSDRVLARGELRSAAHIEVQGGGRRNAAVACARPRLPPPFRRTVRVRVALLALDPLPELEASGYSYGLSALLLVIGALALYAGYRMVAAVVGYSERRNDFVSAVTHELKTPADRDPNVR